MNVDPHAILAQARAARDAGDYAGALAQFDYFFGHPLEGEWRGMYGVRLSFCLADWARLGEVYPPALRKLEDRADAALEQLGQSREPARFHEFIAICRYLKRPEEPIRRFLGYHTADRELATSIVKLIWDELVGQEHWQVCAAYLAVPTAKYDAALDKFDRSMELGRQAPHLGGGQFEEQAQGWYVRDVANLLLVLTHAGSADQAAAIHATMTVDMLERGHAALVRRIDAEVAL